MELDGASILLTGGSRGLGPVIARALLARGGRVTLSARSAEDLEKVKASLDGDRVAIVAGDVSNETDRETMLADAEAAFGPVDILVNNAGIESNLPFPEYTEEEIHGIIAVNLDAAIQMTRLAVPGMLKRGRGHVVNMASLAGKAAVPYNTVYAATKHGLVGFTYSLRAELHGTGVSVSVVCPGYVTDVGMFAEGRIHKEVPRGSGTWTTPARVAAAVVRAIEQDVPDIVVAGFLGQLADVAIAISPRMAGAAARRNRAYRIQELEGKKQAAARRRR
ncbi:MAG TPA: SDR family oxidoreductase [Actinomycetota bacterium]|nr:SDR family oxidoreductase [Actinomycetota bacterium]